MKVEASGRLFYPVMSLSTAVASMCKTDDQRRLRLRAGTLTIVGSNGESSRYLQAQVMLT